MPYDETVTKELPSLDGGVTSLMISRNSADKMNIDENLSKEMLPPRLDQNDLDIVTSPVDSSHV